MRTTLMSHDYDDARLTWNKVIIKVPMTENIGTSIKSNADSTRRQQNEPRKLVGY